MSRRPSRRLSRRRFRTRPVAALCLAGAVCMALGSLPAHAEVVRTVDAAHDVVSIAADGEGAPTPTPDRAQGDVLGIRIAHGTRAIRVSMRVSDLMRDAHTDVVHVFSFRTARIRRAELGLVVAAGDRQGERSWISKGSARTCSGLRTHIDYRADRVHVVVPRRCLENPSWVRVGGGVGYLAGADLFADDVHRDATVRDNLAWGPRVRHG